ncbi:MFS transporter [Leifsonia aquatica]|uniref:MFS transporter n=1 Tax=Leifsonia aquatica TaxID=144185 RepID=UPI0038068B4C
MPSHAGLSTLAASSKAVTTGRFRALLGLSLGYFMVLLDTTVLSVAEPDIAQSLHVSVGGLQWVVNGYTITLAAFLLSAGAISDRCGAHRTFRYGTAVFGLLSALSAVAPSVAALIIARALLGVAAAACVPSSTAMIATLYPESGARARALALWTAISGVGLALGPLVGGVLVELAGWRSVFLINMPIAIVVLILVSGHRFVSIPVRRHIDFLAQLLACATLGLFSGSLISFGGGQTELAVILASATLVSIIVLVGVERRSASPVFAPAILRTRGVIAGLIVGALVNFALTGVIFALPLLLVAQLGLTPEQIGLYLLPLTVPCAINPLLTGLIVTRKGTRIPIVGGLFLLAVGSTIVGVCIAVRFPTVTTACGLALIGFGISFTLPALINAVIGASPHGTAGTSSGLLNAVRQTGATIGVAVIGAALTALPASTGGPAALAIIAGLAAAGCVSYAMLTRADAR